MGNDRPAGLLTSTQRDVLTGDKTYEGKHAKQQRYQRRNAIRKRLRNGLLDLELINENLDEHKLRQIGELKKDGETETIPFLHGDGEVTENPVIDPEIENALVEMVSFVFQMTADQSYMESITKAGVERALERLENEATVGSVDIPIEVPEVIGERIDRYIEEGEIPLSESEIRVALEQDVRSPDEIAEYVKEHGTRQEGLSQQALRNLSEDLEDINSMYGSETEE